MPTAYEPITIDIDQVKELYTELSKLIYDDMDRQYKEKKINGATYAATWAQLMQSVVNGSLQTIASLQMKETEMDRCVKQEQCDSSKATTVRNDELADADIALKSSQKSKVDYERTDILPTQKALSIRQEEGFDDNLRQKLFEAQMNAWAMMFSSGLLEAMPCFISSDEASKLYSGILSQTMPSYTPPAGGCTSTP